MKFYIRNVFCLLLISFSTSALARGGYSFGYRLDFATSSLNASNINKAFPDFESGHTSAFFFRKFFDQSYYAEIAPGAWNSVSGNSQFTFQYSTLGIGYQAGESFIFDLGASLGEGLIALTTGGQSLGKIQTSSTVLRKDSTIYTLQAGGGYKFGDYSILFNLRYFGFIDSDFSKLNNLAAGFSVAMKL